MTNGEQWAIDHPELAKLQGASKHANLATPSPRKPTPVPLPLRAPERAGDVLVVVLPLPHAQLHKNGSKSKNRGWVASLARAAKNAAHLAAWLVRFPEPIKAARIDATFRMARKRDDDGLIHWIFHYRDGIAQALGCNDGNFTMGTIRQLTGEASEDRREVEIVVTRIT